jgi:glycosyltransferase involved in cell wall biosynthesis
MKLSVVISSYNRAKSLARTIASVKKLADEVIVVDNESSDDTVVVAKKLGAKVFSRPNNLMLNVNKNFGFSKATGEWILCLDDDEEVTDELTEEIRSAIQHDDTEGYWIPRKNMIFGKWIRHGIWWPDRQLRLFKRGAGKYAEKHVHEYISVAGLVGTLNNPYTHYNYDSVGQYLEKMQRVYTENEVRKYLSLGYTVTWQDAIRFPASDFIKLYFAQGGYKDGLHGLVLAILQAFYSFLIFLKLWERERFVDMEIPADTAIAEMKKTGKELSYWIMTVRIGETGNPLKKLWYKLARKLGR